MFVRGTRRTIAASARCLRPFSSNAEADYRDYVAEKVKNEARFNISAFESAINNKFRQPHDPVTPQEEATNNRYLSLCNLCEIHYASTYISQKQDALKDRLATRAVDEYRDQDPRKQLFTLPQLIRDHNNVGKGLTATDQAMIPLTPASRTSEVVMREQIDKVISLRIARPSQEARSSQDKVYENNTGKTKSDDETLWDYAILSSSWSAQRTVVEMGLTHCSYTLTATLPLSLLICGLIYTDAIIRHPSIKPQFPPSVWQKPSLTDGPWPRLLNLLTTDPTLLPSSDLKPVDSWHKLPSDIQSLFTNSQVQICPAVGPNMSVGSVIELLEERQNHSGVKKVNKREHDPWVTVSLASKSTDNDKDVESATTIEQHLAARALHAIFVVEGLKENTLSPTTPSQSMTTSIPSLSLLAELTWSEYTWWLSFVTTHPSNWAFDRATIELNADFEEA